MLKLIPITLALAFYVAVRIQQCFFYKFSAFIAVPLIILSAMSFIIVRLIYRYLHIMLPHFVFNAANILLGIFLLLLLYFLIFDFISVAAYPFKLTFMKTFNQYKGTTVLVFAIGTFLLGFVHSFNTKIVEHDIILTDKKMKVENLRVVLLSDIHIGSGMSEERMKKYVDGVNALDPDLIVVTGDTIDSNADDFTPEFQAIFRQLKAKEGVYAIMGNHEYYSGDLQVVESLFANSGMKLLRDEVVYLENVGVYLIGRDYRALNGVANIGNRKPLKEYAGEIDKTKPILVLDHNPQSLDDVKAFGADVQFSGHTHAGQFFPITLIVDKMYENARGKSNDGDFHLVVSSGLGLWGPPMRIGTDSEIVLVNIK